MANSETRKPIGTLITMGGRLEVNGVETMILTSYCPKCDQPIYTPTDWKGDGPPLPAYSCKYMDCPGNLPNWTCPVCGVTWIASVSSCCTHSDGSRVYRPENEEAHVPQA